MTVLEEQNWWASLRGEELILNVIGDPPYDVDEAADYIEAWLNPVDILAVLDFGCGTGRLAEALLDGGIEEIVGVDVNRTARDLFEVSTRGRCRAYASVPAEHFGGAYCVTVFQHLQASECRRIIGEIGARLVPRARFVFQYVEGAVEGFASHFFDWDVLVPAYRAVGLRLVHITHFGLTNWTWVVLEKEAA